MFTILQGELAWQQVFPQHKTQALRCYICYCFCFSALEKAE